METQNQVWSFACTTCKGIKTIIANHASILGITGCVEKRYHGTFVVAQCTKQQLEQFQKCLTSIGVHFNGETHQTSDMKWMSMPRGFKIVHTTAETKAIIAKNNEYHPYSHCSGEPFVQQPPKKDATVQPNNSNAEEIEVHSLESSAFHSDAYYQYKTKKMELKKQEKTRKAQASAKLELQMLVGKICKLVNSGILSIEVFVLAWKRIFEDENFCLALQGIFEAKIDDKTIAGIVTAIVK